MYVVLNTKICYEKMKICRECKETSYTKMTYKKVKKPAWINTETRSAEILMIVCFLVSTKEKIRTNRNPQKNRKKTIINVHRNKLWRNYWDVGFLVSLKEKTPCGEKFTKKVSRKCSFCNFALRCRIIMNLH